LLDILPAQLRDLAEQLEELHGDLSSQEYPAYASDIGAGAALTQEIGKSLMSLSGALMGQLEHVIGTTSARMQRYQPDLQKRCDKLSDENVQLSKALMEARKQLGEYAASRVVKRHDQGDQTMKDTRDPITKIMDHPRYEETLDTFNRVVGMFSDAQATRANFEQAKLEKTTSLDCLKLALQVLHEQSVQLGELALSKAHGAPGPVSKLDEEQEFANLREAFERGRETGREEAADASSSAFAGARETVFKLAAILGIDAEGPEHLFDRIKEMPDPRDGAAPRRFLLPDGKYTDVMQEALTAWYLKAPADVRGVAEVTAAEQRKEEIETQLNAQGRFSTEYRREPGDLASEALLDELEDQRLREEGHGDE